MTGPEIAKLRVQLKHEYRRRCGPIRAWHDAELAALQAQCEHEWEPPSIGQEARNLVGVCRFCWACKWRIE